MERDAIGEGRATGRPPLPVLTTLRFFAAAEVVAFHVAQTRDGWTTPDSFLTGLVSGGFAAVAFFFVLSGFILTYAHAGKTERDGCDVKATTFWRRRFARIAPAYYLGLLVALLFAVEAIAQAGPRSWSMIVGLSSVLLFLQAWWPPYATLWNFPAWSLSVECLFYALFPWLARTLSRWSATALLATTFALIVLVTVCRAEFLSVAGMLPETRPDQLLLRSFNPILHLPQFVFGMALGRLYLFGPTVSPRLHAAMLGSGLGVLVLAFGGAWMLPEWTRSDPALALIFALIVFGGAGATSTATLLTLPAFVLLGEASYSIYILHIPLRGCWHTLTDSVLGLSLPSWLNFPLYFGFVVVASVLAFRHIETPLRHRIAGHRAGGRARDTKRTALWLKA
jgi:peptidoglycan/LPS O-acetylase OafA/YrhL